MTKQEALEMAIKGIEKSLTGKLPTSVEKDHFYKPMEKTSIGFCGHSGYYTSGGRLYRKYTGYKGK